MHVITIDHLTINYAGRTVFQDLSWHISSRDRVGLVGPNGAGKSSLLKAIMGEVIPERGSIVRLKGTTLGYLPQEPRLRPHSTVLAEAMIAPPALADAETHLAKVESQLADPKVYNDEKALARALERQEVALAAYEAAGGARHANRVRELLARLGFTPEDMTLPTETLSGGQKKLVALVQLAAASPSVLLLDEPDNHLDLDAKRRLERFIRDYDGAVVIVSHDRYLLDEVATKIAELAEGKLTLYVGNYTAYTTERALNRLRQQQMYVAQQKEITRIETAIKRFEHWAKITQDERHIRQARSRRMMLDRMEANGEIIDAVRERRQMAISLEGWRGSTKALELRDLAMAFGDDLLFADVSLLIRHGERVGLVGPNGAGKSVLFRLILGQLEPMDGMVKIGPSTRIGYYSQEHQTLDKWLHRTPLERMRDMKAWTEGEAVAFLGKFLFSYSQTSQPIGTLSGGERSRLQLACLMLEQPNLLLLDEPTNNLDLPSVEVLESALEDFDGAILTISHDRYFLDQVADRIAELRDGVLTCYDGGYTDYLAGTG